MKILKVITIIFVNLILLVMFLIPVEMYYVYKWQGGVLYLKNKSEFTKDLFDNKKINIDFEKYKNMILNPISTDKYFDMLYARQDIGDTLTTQFRPDENIDSSKKPVVFMGCSFTWGDALDEDETISAQFAKLTDRPTYNRGGRGWGLNQFLYQTRRNDFYKQFKEEPEYLFYTYIQDHNYRIDKFKVQPCFIDFQPKYIKKRNHLVEQKPRFYDRFYFVQDYQYYYNYTRNNVDSELVKLYFTEARDAIRKHWQNTKLVILVYPIGDGTIDTEMCNKVAKEGYTVINLKDLVDIDLTDNKYKSDWMHPSAEAWSIILPKVIEKLDIK